MVIPKIWNGLDWNNITIYIDIKVNKLYHLPKSSYWINQHEVADPYNFVWLYTKHLNHDFLDSRDCWVWVSQYVRDLGLFFYVLNFFHLSIFHRDKVCEVTIVYFHKRTYSYNYNSYRTTFNETRSSRQPWLIREPPAYGSISWDKMLLT